MYHLSGDNARLCQVRSGAVQTKLTPDLHLGVPTENTTPGYVGRNAEHRFAKLKPPAISKH